MQVSDTAFVGFTVIWLLQAFFERRECHPNESRDFDLCRTELGEFLNIGGINCRGWAPVLFLRLTGNLTWHWYTNAPLALRAESN